MHLIKRTIYVIVTHLSALVLMTTNVFAQPDIPDIDPDIPRPENTPTSIPSYPQAPDYLVELAHIYANFYGTSGVFTFDAKLLLDIAYCESSYDPNARSGIYVGLYQFDLPTWKETRRKLGLSTDDWRHDAEASMQAAAYKISRDGVGAWPYCGWIATQ